MTEIARMEIRSLKEFYRLMAATREVRLEAVSAILDGGEPPVEAAESLENALAALRGLPHEDGKARLDLDGERTVLADLTYETTELDKDIVYFRQGEKALLDRLAEDHPALPEEVERLAEPLAGKRFTTFITDRDGTTNNYCGRYRSSVQSAYNAVFLTRFARARVDNPVFITSAPLSDFGILDVSVNPEHSFIYGASKGREFLDLSGNRRAYPVDPDKQALLDRLNAELTLLLERPGYERFGLIGSGLQFKFGQTTVARQDVTGSIPEEESRSFLKAVSGLVRQIDPDNENFRIEDTGLDIEIILTIEGEGGVKDFDKGDAIRYLTGELGIDMADGPHLVCGDTASDLPMLAAVREMCPKETACLLVTQKDDLARRTREACPQALIAPVPDVLVALCNRLAQEEE